MSQTNLARYVRTISPLLLLAMGAGGPVSASRILTSSEAPEGPSLPAISPNERYHPWLPPLEASGISVGTTRDGYLLRSAALPLEDPDLRILPRQKLRELSYGTSGLVRALVTAAHDVARKYPGSIMSLGDLSAREGGDIAWSVSHNAGRDADIAFFYIDRNGNPLIPKDFVTLNARGIGSDRRYLFDVPRNWEVVRSLLTSPDVQVQWLFIYAPLRDTLLAHARSIGEPTELLEHAAEVLGQPGDSSPHNDHLHLRVLCSDADLREGCRDMGRVPSWVRPDETVVNARIRDAALYLEDADPERRARASELLGLLGARTLTPALVARLEDPSPRVRVAAARGLEALTASEGIAPVRGTGEEGEGATTAAVPGKGTPAGMAGSRWTLELAERLELETDPAVIEAWVGILIRADEQAAIPVLERWLADPRMLPEELRGQLPNDGLPRDTFPGLPPLASRGFPGARNLPLRALAASALAELEDSAAVPALVALVADGDLEVSRQAIWGLQALTNRSSLKGEDPARTARAFDVWLQRHGSLGREAWMQEGFRTAGFPITRMGLEAAPVLLKALKGPPTVAWNANRALCRLTGTQPPGSSCRFEDAQAWWERWLRRHGETVAKARRG